MEEVAKSLSLLVGVRRVPGDVCRLALKPIRDEDLVVMVFARGSQDISSLDGLREVAKDIINVQDSFRGSGWASDILFVFVLALKAQFTRGGSYKSSSRQLSHICPWARILLLQLGG